MAKGRHVARKRKPEKSTAGAVAGDTRDEPLFVDLGVQHRAASVQDGSAVASPAYSCKQLLVLAFQSKTSQHAALSRIEAFYESAQTSKEYLALDDARSQRLCANYEAFNVPLSAVREWLKAMASTVNVSTTLLCPHEADADKDEQADIRPIWTKECNTEERQLLDYLDSLGCLQDNGSTSRAETAAMPTYLVSVLASQIATSLPHEQLHFLYNVSEAYRAASQEQFDLLLPKTRRIIETDLSMRKYAPHVFVDEFQAYVSLDAGEFGAKTREECVPIRLHLLKLQRALWAEMAAQSSNTDGRTPAAQTANDVAALSLS